MITEQEAEEIMNIFEVPEAAAGLLDFFFDEKEQKFILDMGRNVFTAKEVRTEYLDDLCPDAETFIKKKYHDGLISKADAEGHYRINNFYGFLDVFCTDKKEKYDKLGMDVKRRLDDWYLDAYVDTLDVSGGVPTADRVLPLDEIIKVVERDQRPVYLNWCDCRSLTGECGLPRRTCITWKSAANTFTDRGLAEPITKERAVEILKEADCAGLMHTQAMGGICNCCGDCCYLFRAREKLGTWDTWPKMEYITAYDSDLCIGCGRCVERCHMKAFQLPGEGIPDQESETKKCGEKHPDRTRSAKTSEKRCVLYDASKCVGCGLCVNTCPTHALKIRRRSDPA